MAIGEARRPTMINHDLNANSNDHPMGQGSISLTRSNATTPYEPLCQARIEHDPSIGGADDGVQPPRSLPPWQGTRDKTPQSLRRTPLTFVEYLRLQPNMPLHGILQTIRANANGSSVATNPIDETWTSVRMSYDRLLHHFDCT